LVAFAKVEAGFACCNSLVHIHTHSVEHVDFVVAP